MQQQPPQMNIPGGYCGFIDGWCEWRNNVQACKKISAVACRNKREQIARDRSKDV